MEKIAIFIAAASIAAVSGSANAWWGNDNGYGCSSGTCCQVSIRFIPVSGKGAL